MAERGEDDSRSTLVQTGRAAVTFTEMATFVRDLEARPPERLISDLEGLLALPEAKHHLVVMVLRKRMRPGVPERDRILAALRELRGASAHPLVRSRAEAMLASGPA